MTARAQLTVVALVAGLGTAGYVRRTPASFTPLETPQGLDAGRRAPQGSARRRARAAAAGARPATLALPHRRATLALAPMRRDAACPHGLADARRARGKMRVARRSLGSARSIVSMTRPASSTPGSTLGTEQQASTPYAPLLLAWQAAVRSGRRAHAATTVVSVNSDLQRASDRLAAAAWRGPEQAAQAARLLHDIDWAEIGIFETAAHRGFRPKREP